MAAQDRTVRLRWSATFASADREQRALNMFCMSYGHAARNLDAIRAITLDTVALLSGLGVLTDDQTRWLAEAVQSLEYPHAARRAAHVR